MVVSLQWHGNEIIVKQGLAVEQENADLLINVVMEKNRGQSFTLSFNLFPELQQS